MKILGIGQDTLGGLRDKNAVYVDKTEHLHRLITAGGGVYFFSRPRRFGKSLLIDTLKQVFLGNRELFEGTWIAGEGHHDWQARPVFHIDFSSMPHGTTKGLVAGLHDALDRVAVAYGIEVKGINEVVIKLNHVLIGMAAQGKVAVLIDEYDAPIIKNFHDREVCEANRRLLAEFYTALKSLTQYTHFVFLTGVSKFSKTSIFSGMNNLNDISMMPEYATLCGYTQEELEHHFESHIQAVAHLKGLSRGKLLDDMRFWYNGYRFSSGPCKVYNPFSILLFLEKKEFANYWFETGTPTFLMELVKNRFEEFQMVEEVAVTQAAFSASDVENLPLIALLYQTGYVTIKDYCAESRTFTLTYPNEEVRESFSAALLGSFIGKNAFMADALFTALRMALRAGNTDAFCSHLQSLIGGIPHNLHIQREAYYHSMLHIMGGALGGAVSELATSKGRIDLVLQSAKHVFVIEMKIDASAAEALAQIKDRRYYEPFMGQGRTVHAIGLNLDFENKVLTSAVEVIE